jgi:hypothetical protein
VPILTVVESDVASAQTDRDLSALAQHIGANALVGPALSAQISERYATRDEWQDTLQDVRARISRTKQRYNEAIASAQREVADALLRSLEQDADALLAQPLGLDRVRENREAVMGALLFIADVSITDQPTRAAEAVRKLCAAFPNLTLSARAASSAVRALYRETVQQIASASLVVQSVPDACQVRHNGVMLGNAPVQLQGLVAGQHRLSIRCGGRSSLVHRVSVGTSATSTARIDLAVDRALVFGVTPGLRYDSERIANERMTEDAAVVASALGAERAVLYRARTRHVYVIDVVAHSVLRELDDREHAQIARALGGSDAASSTRTAPTQEPPAVAVRPVQPARQPVRAPAIVAPRAAPSATTMVLGVAFTATGLLFAGAGTGAWIGGDVLRARALRNGEDGLGLGGVTQSLSSAESPLRVLAVAGWLAGAGLSATGITMIAIGARRSEPRRVSFGVWGQQAWVAGAF